MSGIESVTFGVLGVLPLVISAAEHYNECHQAFVRYRKFAAEVDRFQQYLKIQKTIFRNQCRILLGNVTTVTQQDAASSMLGERSHPLWADPETEQQIAHYLKDSREACVTVIELIEGRLKCVERESHSLGAIVDEKQGVGQCASTPTSSVDADINRPTQKLSIGDKTWRHRTAKKLKFAFSESRLDEHLVALRTLNDDFRTLSSQNISTSNGCHTSHRPLRQVNKDLQRCQAIRIASQQVYDALGRACTKHTEHLAHFNLHVEQGDAIQERKACGIKFKLAFRHVSLVGSGQGDPLWFMVDSILQDTQDIGSEGDSAEFDQLGKSLKRQIHSPESCGQKSSVKRVRFESLTYAETPTLPSVTFSSSLISTPTMRRDFCDYLRRWVGQSSKSNVCIGMLEATERCKHFVYPLPSTLDDQYMRGTSLQGFLKSVLTKKTPHAFPQYDRLCLAKTLALAVLQYYTTPWLKIAWRSQDILFFNDQRASKVASGPNFSSPHLNVKVTGTDQWKDEGSKAPRSLAPNSILFGLGVVLLEIAYSAPLKSLQQSCDLENGIENPYTDFFTARRLVKSIGREMGSSYGTIVKKLLRCDFGCGDDLSNRDLQAGYYRDVVCELDRLEQGFRQLQIG